MVGLVVHTHRNTVFTQVLAHGRHFAIEHLDRLNVQHDIVLRILVEQLNTLHS